VVETTSPMTRSLSLLLFAFLVILESCSSGKSAYKHGDYYDAVLAAVQRLRQNPDHKKSKEVLSLSYEAALNFLETDAQNQINANANFKWRGAVQDYQRINNLYEQIRTSPGAMKVITNPVNKYKELTDAKTKAAEEVYEAGVQAMLKNTKPDAKQAYFYFKESNDYSPGFREAIEMSNQAEYNATMRVSFDETNASNENFSLQPAVMQVQRQFLKFYSLNDARTTKDSIEQNIKLVYKGCNIPLLPSITSSTEDVEKDIKVGEKDVNGKKEPVYEKAKVKVTTYTRTITATCGSSIQIVELGGGGTQLSNTVQGTASWSHSWATYKGDARALSNQLKEMALKKELFPPRDQITENARRDLISNVSGQLKSFYSAY
jgi:hypothetical protein